MRSTRMLWVAGLAWAGVALGQALPRGVIMFPKRADLSKDPPSVFLKDYAEVYQALKAGDAPPKLGSPFMIASAIKEDPRACTAIHGMAAFTEFSTSWQR